MLERSLRSAEPAWLRAPAQRSGLSLYVEVLRERLVLIVCTVIVTVGAALVYLAFAANVYEAEAELLVTPVSDENPALVGMPLIRDASDPTRPVETVAELATSPDVADRAARELGVDRSASSLISDVSAVPVAASSVVAITAAGPSPDEAAALANAFAKAVVDDRTDIFHDELDRRIAQLQEDVGGSGAVPGESLESEISRLEFLRSGEGPEVRVESEAQPPTTPVAPRVKLTLAAAVLAGIVFGVAVAFGAQTLDPRLRREEQLRNRYSLPILARVPERSTQRRRLPRLLRFASDSVAQRIRPLTPASVSPAMREAYRTLRANLAAAGHGSSGPRSVLITGSAPSEGKTTTALNLAASFALAGNSVILIEGDLRRPAIASALDLKIQKGIVSAMLDEVPLTEALRKHPEYGPNLRLLLAERHGGSISELFFLRAAQRLVDEAKEHADYVIIDSAPLTAVVDTLPLARQADEVVIVARLSVTRLDLLGELAELLASNDIEPLGFALIGIPAAALGSQYYWGAEAMHDSRRDLGVAAANRGSSAPKRLSSAGQDGRGGQGPVAATEEEEQGEPSSRRARRRRAGRTR